MRSSYRLTRKEIKETLGNMKAIQRNLLTTEEFAAALGLSPKTVRQWTWMRRVPFIRVGRAIRFRPETVNEIIDRGTIPALEPR